MTKSKTRYARREGASTLGLPLLALLALLALALPANALAASAPAVATGAARSVSYSSATLTGSVNPHASNTTYYFQFGITSAYGAQTALAVAGAGAAAVPVSAAVTGLEPLTVYHYRLIAVNATGASTGAERTFKTAKVPLSLAILVAPNPTVFGSTATVQGTLSGTGNAGRAVVLQQNPFPYTAGFANVGNPELTTTTGGFSFPVVGLTQATQFRVVTTTNPPVISPITIEGVAVAVSAHVGRAHRRHYARIYGTVTPAVDGMEVGIMRVIGGRNVLVSGTILRHLSTTTSRFSRTIRVKRHALYRVFVKVTNGAQTSNYSLPLFIR
ncbi:MAG TPA: hypothetical protein VGL57_05575 [Solirubrobacteraceae bacterium]|jgi:hypothetical protein